MTTLQPAAERGPLTGFGNLFRKENHAFWGTRSWLLQAIVLLALINGMLALLLWAVPSPGEAQTEDERQALEETAAIEGPEVFFMVTGMVTAVAVAISGQGAIIDERKSGTLAWILSKPVSRAAVLLSKLVALAIGALAIMIALQGAAAYVQLTLAGESPAMLPYLGGLALLGLNLLFYLTLVLMLGAVFNSTGIAIGVPLLLVFGYQVIAGLLPVTRLIMPWGLVAQVSPDGPALALAVTRGEPLFSTLPIVATVVWCVVFVGIAIWSFRREEF